MEISALTSRMQATEALQPAEHETTRGWWLFARGGMCLSDKTTPKQNHNLVVSRLLVYVTRHFCVRFWIIHEGAGLILGLQSWFTPKLLVCFPK